MKRNYALVLTFICVTGFVPAPSTTVSINSASVTFGNTPPSTITGDTWTYHVDATWTTPGYYAYNHMDISCEYLDSSNNLVTTLNMPVIPAAKDSPSPVSSTRSGFYGGAQTTVDYYASMNPKWKSRVAKCRYSYKIYASVGNDANEGASGVTDYKVFTSATFVP